MKIRVTFENEGGELDFAIVTNEKAAREAAIQMIKSAPYLQDGDMIKVKLVTFRDQQKA